MENNYYSSYVCVSLWVYLLNTSPGKLGNASLEQALECQAVRY